MPGMMRVHGVMPDCRDSLMNRVMHHESEWRKELPHHDLNLMSSYVNRRRLPRWNRMHYFCWQKTAVHAA